MSNSVLGRGRVPALVTLIFLACPVPTVNAVVKNISIVDADGNTLPNTKVTITFPDGTTTEEESDDDGMLIYDFPGDGDYQLTYPGGSMKVNVKGGVPTWAWVAGGAAVVAGVAIVASDSSDSSSSDSPGSGSHPSSCTEAASFLSISTTITSNPGDHPNDFGTDYEIQCNSPPDLFIRNAVTFQPQWTCTLSNGVCNAGPSSCTYAGNSTTCSLMSTFTEIDGHTSWTGTMSAGLDGGLPGGQAIEVSFVSQ